VRSRVRPGACTSAGSKSSHCALAPSTCKQSDQDSARAVGFSKRAVLGGTGRRKADGLGNGRVFLVGNPGRAAQGPAGTRSAYIVSRLFLSCLSRAHVRAARFPSALRALQRR
jgi:hypothetical protein